VQHDVAKLEAMTYTPPMDAEEFNAAMRKYPLLIVNFFAPWSPWSCRFAPTWQAVMEDVRGRYPDDTDGRVHLGQVDCKAQWVRSPCGPVATTC
jgi:Thioredoxin